MAIIVRCSCGEGFDVPDSRAGQLVPCPECGQPMDIPSHPPVSLSMQGYVGPGAGWNPDQGVPTGDAFDKLPLCPDCRGSGTCPLCRGKSRSQYEKTDWSGLIVYFVFGFWAWATGAWRLAFGIDEHAAIKGCYSCNSNGKCYKCKGYGRLLG